MSKLEYREKVSKTPEDSSVVFFVEPFYSACCLGYLSLLILALTGMSVSELLQINAGDDGYAKFTVKSGREIKCFKVYTSKIEIKDLFPFHETIIKAMDDFVDVYSQFHNGNEPEPIICTDPRFPYRDLYPEPTPFLFQWGGKLLGTNTINSAINFLLIENQVLLDKKCQPIRITTKILHDGLGFYLADNKVPFQYIKRLFKQTYDIISDLYEYKSKDEIFEIIYPYISPVLGYIRKDDFSFRNLDDLDILKEKIIDEIGFLKEGITAGWCVSGCLCERDSACAKCKAYIPDPRRRSEVETKILFMRRAIEILLHGDEANELSVTIQNFRNSIKEWEFVLEEMNHLEILFNNSLESRHEYSRLLDNLNHSEGSLFPELPSGLQHQDEKGENDSISE